MSDAASRITDRIIEQTLRKIDKVYFQATKEIRQKMKDFVERHQQKNAEMLQKLKAEKITEAEYKSWLRGQVFIGHQWEAKVKSVAKTMTNANKEAAKIVRGSQMETFAENMNYELFQMEKQLRTLTTFDLYDAQTVSRLIKDKPKLLPEWKIHEKKDYLWNYGKIKNYITQGIIQGEGIPQITKRMVTGLATSNDNKMRMFARTANTEAQNAGRIQRMQQAEEELDIKPQKMWVATLDNRTRDLHQDLDGQTVNYDEDFITSDGRKIGYPGDPNADPDLVYNCRCTLKEIYNGHGLNRQRRAYTEDENGKRTSYITNARTYKEWKEMREQ